MGPSPADRQVAVDDAHIERVEHLREWGAVGDWEIGASRYEDDEIWGRE